MKILLKNCCKYVIKTRILPKRCCKCMIKVCICGFIVGLLLYDFVRFTLKNIADKTIKADICLVPTIETDTELLKLFNYTLPFFECRNGVPPLVRQKNNDRVARILFKYFDTAQLNCSYSPIEWDKNGSLYVTDNWRSFAAQTKVKDEYVKVNCSYKKNVVYEDFFAFPPRNVKKRGGGHPRRFNVLLLGMRSVSRLNAYRKLTKFTNYLRYNLQAAEFSKYNAIDNRLLKNIVPLITGKYWQHFKANCTGNECFIWEKFAAEGYKILLAEDCVDNGIFKEGRINYANDSLLPFMRLYESNTGNIRNGECYVCTSSKKAFKILLDYYRNFAGIMHDKRQEHFAMLWINSLTHTEYPLDALNTLGFASDDLAAYFVDLNARGFLENTFVIVFSDGGYVSRKLAKVRQIKQEEKEPLLFIVPPKSVRKRKFPLVNKLSDNSRKLATAFDVHKTLEVIAKLDIKSVKPMHVPKNSSNGLSLLEAVPNRFCNEAGVNGWVCACKYIEPYRSRKCKKQRKLFGKL